MKRQSFPESHEAACTGMARAMTTANQSAANSRRRRNPFRNFMRRPATSKGRRLRPHGFVSYWLPGSLATVSRTVSTMEASSARRSARAGRAAQAFRSYKYPNEICSGVSDIYSVRAHTSDETRDRIALAAVSATLASNCACMPSASAIVRMMGQR
jgi:hypothetical protein